VKETQNPYLWDLRVRVIFVINVGRSDSLGTFIADLVLQILSWMAEDERERIRKRQREGIDVALQRGVAFGRPKATVTEEFKYAYKRWKSGEITAVSAMQEIGVKKTTFYKLVREYEERYRNNYI
jgi:DNA invertase Pin-like site-specific DNA recombinase